MATSTREQFRALLAQLASKTQAEIPELNGRIQTFAEYAAPGQFESERWLSDNIGEILYGG